MPTTNPFRINNKRVASNADFSLFRLKSQSHSLDKYIFLSDTHSHNLIIVEILYRFNVQALAQIAFLYTLRMNVDEEIIGSSFLINYDQDK
jgi:hypothetical protein